MRSSVKDDVALSRLISNISRAVHKSGLRKKGLQTDKKCVFTTIGIGSHHITMHFALCPHEKYGHGLRIYLTTKSSRSPEVEILETPIGYRPNFKTVTIDWLEEKIVQALKQIRSRKITAE